MRMAFHQGGGAAAWVLSLLVLGVGCGGDETSGKAGGADGDPCANQASGTACTWLGQKGQEGFNGDGHLRYETEVNQLQDLLFLEDGTAWLSDFNNHLIRKVLPDQTVKSVVGLTNPVFPGDGPIGGPTPEGGEGDRWQLFHPTALAQAEDGSVLAVGWHNHKLLSINPDTGWVTVRTGGGPEFGRSGFDGDGGPAEGALFNQPSDVAIGDAGRLYIADQVNLRVRKVDEADIITTIAGTGDYGSTGDGGPAESAEVAWGGGSNPNPSGGVLVHEGKLYVADTEADRIRVIDLATGKIDAFAGTGDKGFSGDGGPAKAANLNGPRDMEIGPEGDLYVADTENGAIRAIDLATGIIRTVVGTGELGLDEEEQLPATETHLRRPFGIAFDHDGNLYVVDSLNARIVKIAR